MASESGERLAHYTAYRAAGAITVDGRLDEPSWALAPQSTAFVDIVTGNRAWFETRVAILWDDENLYFGFRAEEPDVWATLTERDSKIYEDNDMEVFIAGQDAYYEFEINALNTIYEVFWIWKDQLKVGGRFHGKPEWDPKRHRIMEIEGIGGQSTSTSAEKSQRVSQCETLRYTAAKSEFLSGPWHGRPA
jgi:hypothetical protein